MSLPIARIATGTHLDLLLASLTRLQGDLARSEHQISTGERVSVPSDDPLAAVRALGYRARSERVDQYLKNISLQSGELAATDGALDALGGVASRAREILISQIGDSATPEMRRNASLEVQALLDEAVSLANRKFGERYLFGGAGGLRAPVELVGNLVAFDPGALGRPEINIGPGEAVQRAASGADAFGALSAEIRGRADLDPLVTAATKLVDLNRGAGARLGSVEIRDGLGGRAVVDLAGAETVGDVLTRLNAAGLVTASLNGAGNGIALAVPGGDLSVAEVDGGHAAGDLGILAQGAGAALAGSDLDPRLRLTTPLAELRGGLGLSSFGFTVTNGATSRVISLAGVSTVEDLLNAVNAPGLHVLAAINAQGTGIDLRSTLSGARLTVEEGAGSAARDLGLLSDLFSTELDRLNGGLGVSELPGDDLLIHLRDGRTFSVDITGAATIGDVINRINNDPENPGTVTAAVFGAENRLRIDDTSVGNFDLQVESLNGSFSAENLGIASRVPNPGATLYGTDLKPAGAQVDSLFNALIALRDGLAGDDRATLSLVGKMLDTATNRLLDTRADVGARMQRLERAGSRLSDEKVGLQGLISDERGVDLAQAVAEFQRQQTILQASYAVTSRILSLSLLDFLR